MMDQKMAKDRQTLQELMETQLASHRKEAEATRCRRIKLGLDLPKMASLGDTSHIVSYLTQFRREMTRHETPMDQCTILLLSYMDSV